MPALAAFEYGNYFFILLQLAESTLSKFLQSDGISFTSKELWKQVSGLASGLAYLHGRRLDGVSDQWSNGKMYHLDLKPANVLIVNGIMKIADFGLSRYKEEVQFYESGSSRPFEGVSNYAPPPNEEACEGYDMFSIGTMLSEIVCFDIGKKARVDNYRAKREQDGSSNSRNFFYRDSCNIKASVIQEHEDLFALAEHSRKSTVGPDKLEPWQEYFYEKTTLFELIATLLSKSVSDRPGADAVAYTLQKLSKIAEEAVKFDSAKFDHWNQTLDKFVKHAPPSVENQL